MSCARIVLPHAFSCSPALANCSVRRAVSGLAEPVCLEGRTVHDQCDGDVLGTAYAVEMVFDVAKNEADLVEIAQMVGRPPSPCRAHPGLRAPSWSRRQTVRLWPRMLR